MSLVLSDLPRDPDRLLQHLQQMNEVAIRQNALLVSLQAKYDTVLTEQDTLRAERDAAQAEIEKLRLLIRQLQRGQFGRRSEKLDPDQLQLGLETSSRPWPRLRRRRRRRLRGTAPLGRPGFGDAIWVPCRHTCRGSRCWSMSRTRAVPAAAGPCT